MTQRGPHVLWVVGPALGHVSRCLEIAGRLQAGHGMDSRFIGSDRHGYHARLLNGRFPVTDVACAPDQFIAFAQQVTAHVAQTRPAAVIFDCSPIPWRLAMPPLPVPTAQVSNYFLTDGVARTWQDERWQQGGPVWARLRESLGLAPIANARALYEGDRVLLADPPALVPSDLALPSHHRVVGACAWSPGGALPAALAGLDGLCFVSFGSTGGHGLPDGLTAALSRACGAAHVLALTTRGIDLDGRTIQTAPLPGPAVLPQARISLTHGGAGSTYQALAFGVPVAVWPTHRNHRLLGERLEETGLGVLLDATDWPQAVARLAADFAGLSSRAQEFAFDLDAGPTRAAQLIAELAV